jgi:hypothetical protein
MFVSRNMYFLTLLVVASLAKTNANAASNETSKLVGKWDLGKYVNIFTQITKIYF